MNPNQIHQRIGYYTLRFVACPNPYYVPCMFPLKSPAYETSIGSRFTAYPRLRSQVMILKI